MKNNNISVPNIEKALKKEVLDYSFLSSSSLKDLEEGIRALFNQRSRIDLSICLSLYKISSEKLFKEAGYKNYSNYLKYQSVIPYATAVDYTNIGKNYIKLRSMIEEGILNDNLNKLKFIPKEFDEFSKETKQEVFNHLQTDSSRSFKIYISDLSNNNIGQPTKKEYMDLSFLFDEALKALKMYAKNDIISMGFVEKSIKKIHNSIKLAKKQGLKIKI